MAIRKALEEKYPGNDKWQFSISFDYKKIGAVLKEQGHLDEALASYRDSLTIMRALVQKDPGNTEWQRDLSVSYNRIGDVLRAQGNLPEALKSYRDSLAIFDRLAKSDPSNVEWQTDFASSLYEVGRLGGGKEANFKEALAILHRLDAAGTLPPDWKGWIGTIEEQLRKAESP